MRRPSETAQLAGYALFSGMLAFAGLPVYVHAPKFFADEYGASLAGIGAVLLALRVVDFAQDPVLGWWTDRMGQRRPAVAAIATAVLAAGIFGLFAVEPPGSPLLWMGAMLAVVFTAYSLLAILLYTHGVAMAEEGRGHVGIAAWREAGALAGVCAACAAPAVLAIVWPALPPFTLYAALFACLAAVAAMAMRGAWRTGHRPQGPSFRPILGDAVLRRLLLIGVLNAAPVAVTATLFLFFVEHRLEAPLQAGPMLITFFVSAAVAAPLWGAVAQRMGVRRALILGMGLSILAFWQASELGAGDVSAFYLICVLSGMALGADITLLPALFAARLAATGAAPGQAFGLWNFCAKITLAVAAATVLPALEASGFSTQGANPPEALEALSVLYALVPCVLKAVALTLMLVTDPGEGGHGAVAGPSGGPPPRRGRRDAVPDLLAPLGEKDAAQ